MTQTLEKRMIAPAIGVDVTEAGTRPRRGRRRCQINQHVAFNTSRLESYCFVDWQPVVFDAMLVAGAVEFADRILRRSAYRWDREIELRIPVHEPDRWNDRKVLKSLHDSLDFLTGDRWEISFTARSAPTVPPSQFQLEIPQGLTSVIPFSDGLDSRAVAGLMSRELGDRLIRVRLGSKTSDTRTLAKKREPFTSVPYKVKGKKGQFVESSARSRGFKFALISGIAAYLVKAGEIIIPESGQGALGPALVTVGQAYEDYRSHPFFTERMEIFLAALLGHRAPFRFPRLWHTKAETLTEFITECEAAEEWSQTWSCWQQNRQVGVDHKKRQCGICAACMLRRMSVHAAGLEEKDDAYVWENLKAETFRGGAAASFEAKKITGKMRQYAVAGALHLDHLATLLDSRSNTCTLNLTTFQLGKSLGLPEKEVHTKLARLLAQHGQEWKEFLNSLGKNSFVADWAICGSV